MTKKNKWFQAKGFPKGVQTAFLVGLVSGVAVLGAAQLIVKQITVSSRISTENGKALYTLGQFYARRIETMRLSPSEAETISQGFKDWAGARIARVDFDANRAKLQDLVDSRVSQQAEVAKKEGAAYLNQFIQSGGVRTLSGLAYRLVKPGSQKKPTAKDRVEVSYRGTFVDGKVFDESKGPNGRLTFPLNGVIPGWTEGLQLVGEGGEIELVIPSELAYGDSGSPSEIPPGSTLLFRIQLHRIIPG